MIYSATYPTDWTEEQRLNAEGALSKEEIAELRQEWETPPDFWQTINAKYEFQVDVCASPENSKCEYYISSEMDSLNGWRPWVVGGIAGAIEAQEHNGEYQHIRAWCNPGFSDVQQWHKKAFEQAQNHASGLVVVIGIPGASQEWYKFAQTHADEIIDLSPRVHYLAPWPLKQSSNNRESMLFVYRRKVVPTRPATRTLWQWKEKA